MTTRFDKCFELVIGHEGGYTTDTKDRGNWTTGVIGKGQLKGTKYGVSAMSYPDVDIKNLTLDGAKAIYQRDYWTKTKCDDLPAGLDYLVFDSAINHGNSRAVRFLQASVGATVDGAIGPKTLVAVHKVKPAKAISEFCVIRGLFYTDVATFQTYKKGWFRRLFDTHAQALQDATQPLSDAPAQVEPDSVCACPDTPADEEELAFWVQLSKTLIEAAEKAAKH